MVEIFGASYDLGQKKLGVRLGPEAIRLAGLSKSLEGKVNYFDSGNIDFRLQCELPLDVDALPKNPAEIFLSIQQRVQKSIQGGHIPLVLGGDHSISIGTVSGAFQEFGEKLAVLWIDAHADLNTPSTSLSGNFHGMSAAALLGFCSPEDKGNCTWMQIRESIFRSSFLDPSKLAFLGLRDLDDSEIKTLECSKEITRFWMDDIEQFGIDLVTQNIRNWLAESSVSCLWISFDVDVLDLALVPGTGTPVQGGLSFSQMHLLSKLLKNMIFDQKRLFKLAGMDVVEVNPLLDHQNQTARIAKEWIISFLVS